MGDVSGRYSVAVWSVMTLGIERRWGWMVLLGNDTKQGRVKEEIEAWRAVMDAARGYE